MDVFWEDVAKWIVGFVVLGLIITGLVFLGMRVQAGRDYQDQKEIDKGTITEKNIENSGGITNSKSYFFELDNSTEYQVSPDDYNEFHVGDYIRIYASGRIEEEAK